MTANLQLKGAKGTCLSEKISSNLRPTKVEASPRPAKGSFGLSEASSRFHALRLAYVPEAAQRRARVLGAQRIFKSHHSNC
jgi:hypothetical protein